MKPSRGSNVRVVAELVLCVLLFVVGVYSPLRTAHDRMGDDIREAQNALSRRPSEVAVVEELEAQISHRRGAVAVLQSRLAQADVSELMKQVDQIGGSLEPLPEREFATFRGRLFDVRFSTSYQEFSRFLSWFENANHLWRVEELEFSKGVSNRAELTGHMRFVLYANHEDSSETEDFNDSRPLVPADNTI